jgi:hypothetical protein
VRFQVLTAANMMEGLRTSETSVNFYQTTRRNIPEESRLKTKPSHLKRGYQNMLVICEIFSQIVEKLKVVYFKTIYEYSFITMN